MSSLSLADNSKGCDCMASRTGSRSNVRIRGSDTTSRRTLSDGSPLCQRPACSTMPSSGCRPAQYSAPSILTFGIQLPPSVADMSFALGTVSAPAFREPSARPGLMTPPRSPGRERGTASVPLNCFRTRQAHYRLERQLPCGIQARQENAPRHGARQSRGARSVRPVARRRQQSGHSHHSIRGPGSRTYSARRAGMGALFETFRHLAGGPAVPCPRSHSPHMHRPRAFGSTSRIRQS